jgi:predicted anti-sigma-YlaC factor YlaD
MSAPAAMDCKDLVELVTEYLEGSLPQEQRARFEHHLAGCEGCTRYLDQMRTTIMLTGLLTEDSIPSDGREELLAVFRSWKEQSPP